MGRELAAADLAIVTDVYPAREQPIAGVTGALVSAAVTRAGGAAEYEADRPALAARVAELLRPGDVLLTLGAGDITRLGREVQPLLVRA